MIGLDKLYVAPHLLNHFRDVDAFQGYWKALSQYTTGLNMIADVSSHGMALNDILEPLQNTALTPQMIKGLHSALCAEATQAGQWKTEENTLDFDQNGMPLGSLETASPQDAPILLEKLLEWTQSALQKNQDHPLLIIAVFTAIFLQISPFTDGNRKLACFLIVLFMLKSGYAYAPFSSMTTPIQERSMQIYEALQHHQESIEDGNPNWQSWLPCFMEIIVDHKNTLAAQLSGTGSTNEAADMPALSLALLDVIRMKKRATMKELMKETRGRRSTIKLRLQELSDQNLIRRHGAGRGVWYSLV